MINREWTPVEVITYKNTKDDHGRQRQEIQSTRTVEMVTKIYSQQNVDSPIYNDVELIGITKDKDIQDSNVIKIGTVHYNIKYVIPSGKYLQVLMSKI